MIISVGTFLHGGKNDVSLHRTFHRHKSRGDLSPMLWVKGSKDTKVFVLLDMLAKVDLCPWIVLLAFLGFLGHAKVDREASSYKLEVHRNI